MKNTAVILLSWLAWMPVLFAANPSYQSFNTNQFGINGTTISIRDHSITTNLTVYNTFSADSITLGGTNITNWNQIVANGYWTLNGGVLEPTVGNQVQVTNLLSARTLVAQGALVIPSSLSAVITNGGNNLNPYEVGNIWVTSDANTTDPLARVINLSSGNGQGAILFIENYCAGGITNSAFTLADGTVMWDGGGTITLQNGDWEPTRCGETMLLQNDGNGWREVTRFVQGGTSTNIFNTIVTTNIFINGTNVASVNPTDQYVPVRVSATAFADSPMKVNGTAVEFHGDATATNEMPRLQITNQFRMLNVTGGQAAVFDAVGNLTNGVNSLTVTNYTLVAGTNIVIDTVTAGTNVTFTINGLAQTNVAAANPTASVGLTAVNGSAPTFLRSDGAPALDQSITPTWTGIHTYSANVRATIGAGGTTLDFDGKPTLTNAISGALTFTGASGGVAGTADSLEYWVLNGSGSNWTVTLDSSWINPDGASFTSTNSSIALINFRRINGLGSTATNVLSSIKYYK